MCWVCSREVMNLAAKASNPTPQLAMPSYSEHIDECSHIDHAPTSLLQRQQASLSLLSCIPTTGLTKTRHKLQKGIVGKQKQGLRLAHRSVKRGSNLCDVKAQLYTEMA